MDIDHSVIFGIASKYCILDCFVDYDGYSISSKGFLPTVVDIMVNKRLQNAVLGCSLKEWQNDLCSFPRQTIHYHSNPSLSPTSNAEETEVELFYEDLQDLLELTLQKDVLFIIGDWMQE